MGGAGCSSHNQHTAALAVASNPQTVNGTSLHCPGPHSLDWGSPVEVGRGTGGQRRQVCRLNHPG